MKDWFSHFVHGIDGFQPGLASKRYSKLRRNMLVTNFGIILFLDFIFIFTFILIFINFIPNIFYSLGTICISVQCLSDDSDKNYMEWNTVTVIRVAGSEKESLFWVNSHALQLLILLQDLMKLILKDQHLITYSSARFNKINSKRSATNYPFLLKKLQLTLKLTWFFSKEFDFKIFSQHIQLTRFKIDLMKRILQDSSALT